MFGYSLAIFTEETKKAMSYCMALECGVSDGARTRNLLIHSHQVYCL